MQEKRTPIFQNEDGSWGHVTQTVNPLICTIEYKCHWETGIIMMINGRCYLNDSSRLSENTEDPRKFNIPWVFSFCQNLRICV